MQVKEVRENNSSDQQEGSGYNEDSILENLSPLSGDAASMDSNEYNRLMKDMEDKEKAEVESTPPKHVLATVTGMDEDDDSEKTPPNDTIPGPSYPGAPQRVFYRAMPEPHQGWGLDFGERMSKEELARIAGKDGENITYKEILTKPLIEEDVADPEAFEAKRKELLAEAQKVVKVTASVLQEKMETDQMMEAYAEKERKTEEHLNKAMELRDRWKKSVEKAKVEAEKFRKEPIHPRNINFDSAAHHQPLATSKDNMQKAAELLAQDND
jgi:hypothetical protein